MSDLTERAEAAQDRIGWTNTTDLPAMGQAVLELSRVVVAIARRLDAMTPPMPPPQQPEPIECCASGSCEVCRR